MSTEHQKYSTENQSAAIRQYAARHGMAIVRTYSDAGKSGLRLDGRDELKRLIEDVTTGTADYSAILVYDVSRWGRFQDADESAYYEHICRRAGINVHYCAEQFENDGTIASTIVKTVKRAMAGEYSRELSVKVFAGQCRLIELGFRQGGPAGFGLRRQLVDQNGIPKGELNQGEQKSIQTDRVILVPGPTEEVETVRWMYHAFVEEGRAEREIAAELNRRGIATDLGRPWTRGTVHQVLINEKYIGNNVFNRISFKLKQKRVVNRPDLWVRAEGAFRGIVDPAIFQAAQRIIQQRSIRYSDQAMLDRLKQLFEQKGCLSGLIIDEAEDMPSSAAYRTRFGSLPRAYQLIGYAPGRDYSYIAINRALRDLHPEIIQGTVAQIERLGGAVRCDSASDLLTINEEFTASLVIARCMRIPSGGLRWKIRVDAGLQPDITVAVRMDQSNRQPLDYYLLPRIDISAAKIRLAEDNGVTLDAFRFESLDGFFHLASRVVIRSAA